MHTHPTTIDELLAYWDSGEGRPFKGELIDWKAYSKEPSLGCMCAQGQVLHTLGGWDAESIKGTAQRKADTETAKLLGISRAHAILLRQINDNQDGAPSVVLTDPGKVLGSEHRRLLAFWRHLDRMTADEWAIVAAIVAAAGDAARAAAGAAAGDAARDAAGASNEIQGAAIMRERSQPFFFLPLFGFASPEALDALEA